MQALPRLIISFQKENGVYFDLLKFSDFFHKDITIIFLMPEWRNW